MTGNKYHSDQNLGTITGPCPVYLIITVFSFIKVSRVPIIFWGGIQKIPMPATMSIALYNYRRENYYDNV
jgi:hypothetical protein